MLCELMVAKRSKKKKKEHIPTETKKKKKEHTPTVTTKKKVPDCNGCVELLAEVQLEKATLHKRSTTKITCK